MFIIQSYDNQEDIGQNFSVPLKLILFKSSNFLKVYQHMT